MLNDHGRSRPVLYTKLGYLQAIAQGTHLIQWATRLWLDNADYNIQHSHLLCNASESHSRHA